MKVTIRGLSRFVIVTVMLGPLHARTVSGNDVKHPQQHSIEMDAGDGTLVFGSTVPIHVKYRNDAKEPWVIGTPMESIEVGLKYRRSNDKQRPNGYRFGQRTAVTITVPDGGKITAFTVPTPKPLSISSGKTHEFKLDFPRHWSGHLVPGRWTIWIQDDSEKLESNRIEIPLRFTAHSVTTCLEIALRKEEHVSVRKQYGRWLQRIDPDLELDWPDSDDVRAEYEVSLQRNLKKFSVFLKDAKNSPQIAERIATINREAGLEPDLIPTESRAFFRPGGPAHPQPVP